MNSSSYRCAKRTLLIITTALLLVVGTFLPLAQAALDEGAFDFSQPNWPDPIAWGWSPDSTSDGNGVEYIACLSSFEHAGAMNPTVTTTADYHSGVDHQSLQAFIDWVVVNNANVQSSTDLTITRHVVTTVTLP